MHIVLLSGAIGRLNSADNIELIPTQLLELASGPMQFQLVKDGIDVNNGTAFADIMFIDRNVMFGLLALIAIGFVALIVGDFLH